MPQPQFPAGQEASTVTMEKWGSLNTQANRPTIGDDQFAWNSNWFPIGDGNLRTMWAEGTTLYTASKTVVFDFPYNIGSTSYIANFYSDGTADQINVATSAVTAITTTSNLFYQAGVSTALPHAAQYESQYLVIVASVTSNGYFLWDGSNLYQAGTLSPDVTVTQSGQNYTSAPTVTAYGGSGSGATFSATVQNGAVTKVQVTNPGSGYAITDIVQLAFSGGGSDTSARATATIANTGGVAQVNITAGGTGYTTSTTLTFSGGGGSGAQAVITGLDNGVITQVTVTNPGTGYTSAPTISAGTGGFAATVDIRRGQVASITIPSGGGGSGYTSNPQVQISAPDAASTPIVQATAVATVSSGAVTAITVTQAGLGYTKPPTITLIGGNLAAAATITLMPFGVEGTSVETFQNSVWLTNKTNILATSPGTTSNFATSAGGVLFTSSDSFLRQNFIGLKQTSGLLYAFGDSSVGSFSNVQTTASAAGLATTTFNYANIDPQIGTAWRDSIVPYARSLVFANASGIYALYGGAVEKISTPLDGLFTNASFNTGASGVTPSSAIAIVFGIRVFMMLFTTIDPYQNVPATILAMWDGQKWFTATQIKTPTFISTREINSVVTAWATDGTNLYPMFGAPSTSLNKVFQTKLRSDPFTAYVKQVNRVYVTAEDNAGLTNTLNVSIDTEKGLGAPQSVNVFGSLTFIGTGAISFVGTGPITWSATGLVAEAYAPPADYGRYIGLTCQSTALDVTLLQLGLIVNAAYSENA